MSQHAFCNSHRQYQLNCPDYDRLIARAAGRCEICGVLAEENHRGKLVIDHDHLLGTWAVRGLLCYSCNSSLRQRDGKYARQVPLAEHWFKGRPEVQRYLERPFRGLEHARNAKVYYRTVPTGRVSDADRAVAQQVLAVGGTAEDLSVVLRLRPSDVAAVLVAVNGGEGGSN